MSTRKASKADKSTKTPKAPTQRSPAKAAKAQAPVANLAGVVLRIGASKKPDCYRPFVHLTLPDGITYTSLVPRGRTATREEALIKATAYWDQIVADDHLPPRPERFGWGPGDVTVHEPKEEARAE